MSKSSQQPPATPTGIEELILRLEEITRSIENPDTGMEAAVTLYEEGLSIAATCRQRLQETRKKLEVINPDLSKAWPDAGRSKDLFGMEE